MTSSKTDQLLHLSGPDIKKAILDWFDILSERNVTNGDIKINGRAWRAELKRAEPPYGAMLCEAYHDLCRRLEAKTTLESIDKMALSLFASAAAHIKKDVHDTSFAAQLGEKVNGSASCVSKLRFERLLKARTPDDFCRLLIQAINIRGKEGCNVVYLADSLIIWMREWAMREGLDEQKKREGHEKHQPKSNDPFARYRVRWTNEYLSTLR